MKRRSALIETAFTALVLIVVCVVTMLMFVRADTMRRTALDLDRATIAAQSVIEEFKAGRQPDEIYYFDRYFSPVSAR